MKGDEDLHQVPLTALTYEALTLLQCLLNPTKVLFSEGSGRLLRDWRGLANLVAIPSDITSSFEQQDNKCAKVLQYWIEKRDGTAYVGRLLEYMKKIDRFDVFDDFMNLFAGDRLFLKQLTRPTKQALALRGQVSQWYQLQSHNDNIITFDDKIHGCPQIYCGYVLYAMKDREYAMEMVQVMNSRGYKLCTEEDFIPCSTPVHELVIRLISSGHCHWIIPIFTNDFLSSPVNTFYTSYTHALAIRESKRPWSIPCMYKECSLPPAVRSTLVLYYNSNMYDFWERLTASLVVPVPKEGNDSREPYSRGVEITEVSESSQDISPSSSFGSSSSRLTRWFDSLKCWRRRTEIVLFRGVGNSS